MKPREENVEAEQNAIGENKKFLTLLVDKINKEEKRKKAFSGK